MLEPGTRLGFVFAAYAATFVIFASLTIAIAFDAKMQKQRLDKLIASGLKRRSQKD